MMWKLYIGNHLLLPANHTHLQGFIRAIWLGLKHFTARHFTACTLPLVSRPCGHKAVPFAEWGLQLFLLDLKVISPHTGALQEIHVQRTVCPFNHLILVQTNSGKEDKKDGPMGSNGGGGSRAGTPAQSWTGLTDDCGPRPGAERQRMGGMKAQDTAGIKSFHHAILPCYPFHVII